MACGTELSEETPLRVVLWGKAKTHEAEVAHLREALRCTVETLDPLTLVTVDTRNANLATGDHTGRLAPLIGLMAADVVSIVALTIPVILLGLAFGVTFVTGLLGMVVFIMYGALWGLAFAGFPYAIALKTGNPAAVNSSFVLFFPFAFLTTTFLPEEALTGWLQTIAKYNPVTYVLEGLRSLITVGWDWSALAAGGAASIGLMVVSFGLASLTMKGRVARN
jgi:ABC-2 type transport system permease protein